MSNKNYLCILRNEGGGCEQPSSPTEMEAMFAKYRQWQDKFAENIVDMGNKLGSEGAVIRHDSVKDGPFVEVKEIIGGYMTITAATLDEAVDVIKASPMIANSGVSIELREIETP